MNKRIFMCLKFIQYNKLVYVISSIKKYYTHPLPSKYNSLIVQQPQTTSTKLTVSFLSAIHVQINEFIHILMSVDVVLEMWTIIFYNSFISQYFLNYKTAQTAMSKWEDEFDFDDLDAKPKKAKDNKKNQIQNEQFFDFDQQPPTKASKLPVINKKTLEHDNSTNNKDKNTKKSKNTYEDYQQIYEDVEQIKSPPKKDMKKKKEQEEFYQQLEDLNEIKPKKDQKPPLKVSPKANDEQQYYEEIEQVYSPPKNKIKTVADTKSAAIVKKKQEQMEDYQQNFDDYGQDFQEEIKQIKKVEPPKKSITTVNLKAKGTSLKDQNLAEDKKTLISNKVFMNKEVKNNQAPPIPKQPLKENKVEASSKKTIQLKAAPAHGLSQPPKKIQKSSSRKSLKSNDSKSNAGYSRVSKNNVSMFTPNKHINLVEKSFPDQEDKLNTLNIDKLARLNEQVRDMIRKFNEQLNDLINKNMILLKEKPNQKQKSADEKVRLLQEQLRSGATALEVIENEYERLKGREGELREEQYQLIMQKKIQECKEQAKETVKVITKLKFQMNNDGNKLSKHQIQKKMTQELHQIKIMLIQLKKEEEKNEAKISKVDKMIEELQGKNSDKQYELSQQIDTAKQKGIVFGIKEETRKKYEQLKVRVLTADNHRKCMKDLYKNKSDIIAHQNDQIRITIKSIQSQINNLCQSIEHSQQESIKAIKKVKENSKISPAFAGNLDKLLKSIEDSQNANVFEIRTEGNKSQASERPLKTSMYENITKQKPARNSAKKEPTVPKTQPHPDQLNLMKPNFMKKKEKHAQSLIKEDQKTNKVYERVWNEEDQHKKKEEQRKTEEKRIKEEEAKKQEQRKAAALLAAQQEKKKPFTIKKNRMNQDKSMQHTPEHHKPEEINNSPKPQPPVSVQPTKAEQDKPAIAPRMMRFNRKERNNNDLSKNEIKIQNTKEQVKIVKEVKEEPAKLVIDPPSKLVIDLPKPVETLEPAFVPKRFNLRNKIQKKQQSYVPTAEIKVQEKKEQKKEEKKQEIKEIKPANFSLKDEISKNPVEGKKIQIETKIEEPEQKPKFMLRLRDRQKKQNNEAQYIPTRMTQVADDKTTKNNINLPSKELKKEEKPLVSNTLKSDNQTYQPSFKANVKPAEKDYNIQNPAPQPKPKQQPLKQPINNPYAVKIIQKEPSVVNNPYAPKEDAPKKEREGPVKKIKIQNKEPKPKFNIYEQAEDITEPVSQPVAVAQPEPQIQKPAQVNLGKTSELDLNAMLGIKKPEKKNDLDDLLGDIKIDKKKERKKNNDFFNDLQL